MGDGQLQSTTSCITSDEGVGTSQQHTGTRRTIIQLSASIQNNDFSGEAKLATIEYTTQASQLGSCIQAYIAPGLLLAATGSCTPTAANNQG